MTYQDLFVEKYRPTELEHMVLDPAVRERFGKYIKDGSIPNLLLYGKPGGGKTTLARILASKLGWETLELNASDENGVDAIRDKVYTFCTTASIGGTMKLVVFEEADGLSSAGGNGSSAQQILKNLIEESSDTVRFVMTVNDLSKIDDPIKSRMNVFHICPPKGDDGMYKPIIRRLNEIRKAECITMDYRRGDPLESTDLYKIAKRCYPDIREAVSMLQRFSYNPERHLKYVDEGVPAKEVASMVVDALVDKFLKEGNPLPPQEVNRGLVEIRSLVVSAEDSFGADYHAVMRECFELFLDSGAVPDAKKREVILEVQDRMKWYSQVLDREIHFFAMVVAIAQILYS